PIQAVQKAKAKFLRALGVDDVFASMDDAGRLILAAWPGIATLVEEGAHPFESRTQPAITLATLGLIAKHGAGNIGCHRISHHPLQHAGKVGADVLEI